MLKDKHREKDRENDNNEKLRPYWISFLNILNPVIILETFLMKERMKD